MNKLSKFVKRMQFKRRQRKIEKQIEKDGLTDELFEAQVALNIERNKHNISDRTKKVYKNYVQ